MIKIKKNSIIYVQAPPYYFSGGPLALHQLAYQLRKNSYNAVIYYDKKVKDDPVHENFKKYDIPYTFKINDDSDNVLIISEFNTTILYKYTLINKVIWWLSVDNYFKGHNFLQLSFTKKLLLSLKFLRIFDLENEEHRKSDILHLAQSKYAYEYLKNKGIKNLYYLHCYLEERFNNIKYDLNAKKDIIVFNPKKGIELTRRIIERLENKEISFVPIQNMSITEVQKILLQAKVYIDFGNHPGRDRFPREAALHGCSIITNKKGSAKNNEDVNIPEEYKFEGETEQDLNNISELILAIIKDHKSHHEHFSEYRKTITKDEKRFQNEIQQLFIKQWMI